MPKLMPVPGSQTTSSSIGSDLLARVRALLNETTASFWDDNDIYQWLTDGIVDITGKTYCTGATENVTLASGTLEYTLSTNYIDIVAVIYNGAKSLLQGHPSMLGHVEDPEEVVYYYEFDGKIGFIPKPDTNDNTLVATVYLIPTPTTMPIVAGTSIPTPVWFDDSLVLYAVSMALFRDNEMSTALQTLREYDRSIERWRRNISDRPANRHDDVKGKE